MAEPKSVEGDRVSLLQCRARVADTHARVALLDEVLVRTEPPLAYASIVHNARVHLEAALADLDAARTSLELLDN